MGFVEQAIAVLATLAFLFAGVFVILFSMGLRPRKRLAIWFIAAFGFLIYAFYSYFQLGQASIPKAIAGLVGSISILYGLSSIFYEISNGEVSFGSPKFLEKRRQEIKSVIENITEKYGTKQITEDELFKIRGELIKELAELEVKLRK